MKQPVYIARRLAIAVLLLLSMALAPARAQIVVYVGDTTPLDVVEEAGFTYMWEIYTDATVDFATVPGDSPGTNFDFVAGNTAARVDLKWINAGIYFYKVTVYNITGCASNFKIGMLEVKELLPTATITDPDPNGICKGEPVKLDVTFTGTGPWNFTYTDGTNTWTGPEVTTSPYQLIIDPGPTEDTNYQINSVSTDLNGTNPAGSNTVIQKINPLPAPATIYHN